jgi:CubicO group peptidase (beta-lactamase class C family)
VGSTTKAFTAAALGLLIQEGRLGWDTRVVEWLPDFRLRDDSMTQQLTVRDTLTHSSGIGHSYLPFLRMMEPKEAVRELRYVIPEAPFRRSYIYSNLMYAVAGEVIEAVCGCSWHDFIRQQLLRPLKMTRSYTTPYALWEPQHVAPAFLGSAPGGRPRFAVSRDANVAMPHVVDEHGASMVWPWQSYDSAAAAGSIASSAGQMANWVILNLNDGRFEGHPILDAPTLDELHAAQNPCEPQYPFEGRDHSYAMGWIRGAYRGHIHLAHGGGMLGFPAYVALLPRERVGVVVLSNGATERREEYGFHKSVAFEIFDRLLGVTLRDWSTDFRARRQSVQVEEASRHRASLDLHRYVGTYQDSDDRSGAVTIRRHESGGLELRFAGAGAFGAPLRIWQDNVFRLHPSAPVGDVLGPVFATFCMQDGEVACLEAFNIHLRRISGTSQ